ncbi:STAS domain-containing protein [Heliobacterium mobile]
MNTQRYCGFSCNFVDDFLQDKHKITFDFSKVTFMDSTGLSVLVRLFKITRNLAKEFRIIEASPFIKDVFTHTKLNKIIHVQ